MATDVYQAYQGWSQGELSDGDESHEISASQMLDHGSISFGRFPIESLSWERKSVFTHNRCQEELEKFNGLVAKKKAYFEERYRRIRALKAQQNQQTELTLDYGGYVSISSQSEEDGTTSQHESLRDGAANNVHSPSEKAKAELRFEQEINCNEPLQERCFDSESTLTGLTLSREFLGKLEPDKNSIDTVPVQPLETDPSLPLTGEVEEIQSNCSSKLEDKEILQKHKNLISNIELRTATRGTTLNSSESKSHQLQSIKKKLDCKSFCDKVPGAVRNDLSSKRETKLNVVQPSKVAKTAQKMVGKAESSQTLRKTTVNGVKNSASSTLVASNGLLVKASSNIRTPGPFTLVMERRASSRRSAAKLDCGSSSKQASSLNHAKGGVQDMLKKMAAISGMTSGRRLEIKRDLKEARNKPLELNSQHRSLNKTEARVLGPPKSRSINLPARNKSTLNSGTESQISTLKGAKQKKGNARMREFQRVTTMTTGPSMAITVKMGTKKEHAIREADLIHSGRKPRIDDLSLDGKKTRRETPQWR